MFLLLQLENTRILHFKNNIQIEYFSISSGFIKVGFKDNLCTKLITYHIYYNIGLQ
jgi:hypothetical protein